MREPTEAEKRRNALNAVRHIRHGQSGGGTKRSRAYNTWANMKHRCMSPTAQDWKYYGGRGIIVCERWHSFENFVADMGEPPEGMSIDRIDADGNYEPSNCRWATRLTQSQNRRPRNKVSA